MTDPTVGRTPPPATGQPEPTPENSHHARSNRRLESAVGWAASLVLHTCILLACTGVTWLTGEGDSAERQAGIFLQEPGDRINMATAELERIQAATAPIRTFALTEPQDMTPVETAQMSTAISDAETIVTVEMSAGSAQAQTADDWAGLGTAGTTTGGGTSFFGLQARGRDFVFVVDRSGSMIGEPLLAAKAELIRSITALKRHMRFFIIFYNNKGEAMAADGLVRATTRARIRHFTWVDSIEAAGGTDPTDAMQQALALKPDTIWLLSDRRFSEKACDAINKANPNQRVQIHTIAFCDNAGEAVLQRIAKENRGGYRFVPRPKNRPRP